MTNGSSELKDIESLRASGKSSKWSIEGVKLHDPRISVQVNPWHLLNWVALKFYNNHEISVVKFVCVAVWEGSGEARVNLNDKSVRV